MRELASDYVTDSKKSVRNIYVKIMLNDAENTVLEMDSIVSVNIQRSLTDGSFGIGFTPSDRLTFTAVSDEKISKKTRITVYVKFASDGTWERLGRFYCEECRRNGRFINVVAFDAMNILTDKKVKFTAVASKELSELTFPCLIQDMLDYIVAYRGLTCEFECQPFYVYNKPMKSKTEYYTARELIGFIASAHGKNARFNYEGKLEFKAFSAVEADFTTSNVIDQTLDGSEPYEVTGVLFKVGENQIYIDDIAGSEYDEEAVGVVKCNNPFGSLEIAEYVWSQLGGLLYYGGNLTTRGAGIIECGDVISVNNLKYPFDTAIYPFCITGITYSISREGFNESLSSNVNKSEGTSVSEGDTSSKGLTYTAGEGIGIVGNEIRLAKATGSKLGGVMVSPDYTRTGIWLDTGTLSIKNATSGNLGGIKLGDGLVPELTEDDYKPTGVVNLRLSDGLSFIDDNEETEDPKEINENLYGGRRVALAPSTKEKIGGVIVGEGLDVDENGTLSVASQGKTYTAGSGIHISDSDVISVKTGEGIEVDENGAITAKTGIENALFLTETTLPSFIHEYTEVGYISGQKVILATQKPNIVIQGYTAGNINQRALAPVYTSAVLSYLSSQTSTEIGEYNIELAIYSKTDTVTNFMIKVNGTSYGPYQTFNPETMGFILCWSTIYGESFATGAPKGCVQLNVYAVMQSSQGTITYNSVSGIGVKYYPFDSTAEYHSAICLTEEDNVLTSVSEAVREISFGESEKG